MDGCFNGVSPRKEHRARSPTMCALCFALPCCLNAVCTPASDPMLKSLALHSSPHQVQGHLQNHADLRPQAAIQSVGWAAVCFSVAGLSLRVLVVRLTPLACIAALPLSGDATGLACRRRRPSRPCSSLPPRRCVGSLGRRRRCCFVVGGWRPLRLAHQWC